MEDRVVSFASFQQPPACEPIPETSILQKSTLFGVYDGHG
jgi:hypothetical protein